ncbi:acetoacetyl-CoA synthase [Viridothelium virens]|uniref:Acetoacetyl-CoA synthase n=1 Tax=Viridothelium virens TaxID=1048519 RepID=A0A6A6HLN2_VIRVR|nr:acetoacetyl-CoA synthase [Viridothelium virens]
MSDPSDQIGNDENLSPAKLWTHPSPGSTPMWKFMQSLNGKYGLQLKDYHDLHKWSIENIPSFWDQIWHQLGIKAPQMYSKVVDGNASMFPRPTFFSGAKLNFAENFLFPSATIDADAPAVIAASESSRESISWNQLRDRVRRCQAGMIALEVKRGDRIAGYVANHVNALVAMLAATSLGAVWTAVSPDTGVHAVLERLTQIEPSLLFADESSAYNGKTHPVVPKIKEVASSLPSLRGVVIFETSSQPDFSSIQLSSGQVYSYNNFLKLGSESSELAFTYLDPDHPVYILYSSGTTGAPKCIVHGAIGTLIQHKKEHALHCSIGPQSRLFYFTTCTWMMWHWLVSGLASGATLILYDGSPFRYKNASSASGSEPDDLAMPRLCEELGITHLGTSAKYLSVLEQKNIMPREVGLSLAKLEAIYSTGSPLAPSTFSYVYRAFPPTINLGSITGGTDIISLFGAPCPLVPVYEGEIQCLGLGMAVQAWDFEGRNVSASGEPGDLVCVQPFPCEPVQFWGQDGEQKYRASYFEKFPGVWHHGDFVRFHTNTGGLVMLGRSDGILKPAGVRFGSAEIYNVLLEHFPGVVADALCIGRRREKDTDETVVLFLKMEPGNEFSDQLSEDIQKVVRSALSARHVPGIIDECPDIPVTTNGKKVEGSVKQILCGMNVKTSASVANAECLDWYREWAKMHD